MVKNVSFDLKNVNSMKIIFKVITNNGGDTPENIPHQR